MMKRTTEKIKIGIVFYLVLLIILLFSMPMPARNGKEIISSPVTLDLKDVNYTIFHSPQANGFMDKMHLLARFRGTKNQTVFAVLLIKSQGQCLIFMLGRTTLNNSGEGSLRFQWLGQDYLGKQVADGNYGMVLFFFNSPLLFQQMIDTKPIPAKVQELLLKSLPRMNRGETLKKWEGETDADQAMLALNEKAAANARQGSPENMSSEGTTAGEVKRYAYTVDGADNITSQTETKNGIRKSTNFVINSRNQVVSFGKRKISYDGNGNVSNIQNIGNTSNTIYSYDFMNRLLHVEDGQGMTADYVYDPLGRRLLKKVNRGGATETIRYVWDGWQVIEERDGSGNLTARYTYGNGIDEPVEIERKDPATGQLRSYVPMQDTNGNVLGMADADGNLVEKVSYTPYGTPTFIYDHEKPKVDQVRVEGIGHTVEGIRIRFSEEVNEQSARDAIIVKQGSSNIDGSLAFAEEGKLAIFTPASALPQNELLTINISTDLSDEFGNKLASAFSQGFTYPGTDIIVYDRVPPEVGKITYNIGKFAIAFMEEIDAASVSNSVELKSGNATINGNCNLQDEKVVVFTPNQMLNAGSFTIKPVIRDWSGKTNLAFSTEFDLSSDDNLIYEKQKESEHAQSYIKNTTLFQGRELDYETGLYYFRNRHFNPELGRFMQPDPKGYVNSMNLYQGFGNNPINFKDPFGFDWAEYSGQIITWYGGKPKDRTKPLEQFPATSGYIGYQNPKLTYKKRLGPIPNGMYRINIKQDPDRWAIVNIKNGDLFWNSQGGIERISWNIPAPGGNTWTQPGWGTVRAYLEPDPNNIMHGRFPVDRFYVHNSNKGFSHGCVETSNGFFNRLLKFRLEHPEEIFFQFNVHYIGESTYGGTENAFYPPLNFHIE